MSKKQTEQKKENGEKKKEEQSKKKQKNQEDELSEEDKKLKENLELLVERSKDNNEGIAKQALEALTKEIRESTSSLTSVPKPLKFLRPHFEGLQKYYEEEMKSGENKQILADILSVLAVTSAQDRTKRECLKYKLEGKGGEIDLWGNEYIRHLSGEIAKEFEYRTTTSTETTQVQQNVDDLMALVSLIVPYNVSHNAKPEACDLLMEVESLPKILEYVDKESYERISLYLIQCSNYVPEPEDKEILCVVRDIYHKLGKVADEMRICIKLGEKEKVKNIFNSCEDKNLKRQLGFILASQQYFEVLPGEGDDDEEEEDEDEDMDDDAFEEKETIGKIVRGGNLSDYFQSLARDLDILDPKSPEDIYKSHLDDSTPSTSKNIQLARHNLASSFVNGFVNAGFRVDKLMTTSEEGGSAWVYKNREHGRVSTVASLGLILLWDIEGGCQELDKYMYATEDHIFAGALLGIGLVNAGVRDEFGSALGLLRDHLVEKKSAIVKNCGSLGLGIAYAGSCNKEVKELLLPIIEEGSATIEVLGHFALSLGLTFVGSCDVEISEALVTLLIEKSISGDLKSSYTRFICLGIGLLFLGKQEKCEIAVEAVSAVSGVQGKYAALTIEGLAYAGSGNVLKIQKMLHECSEHLEENDEFQGVAVLNLALIALSEGIGSEMIRRSFDHLLQYGEKSIRKAVPLALSLLCVSNPDVGVADTLSKLSHDHHSPTAQAAIFGLGLISAGTNNSRISKMLRGLASYYSKDSGSLFVVRIAQGLCHAGKGTISMAPFSSSGLLLNNVAVGGLAVLLHSLLDMKGLILSKAHYLIYLATLAMKPRMLMTFNEELEPVQALVRVGKAVDVLGQAGKPKTITGFQTHKTPVLLGAGERAELVSDQYIPYSDVLEGFIILKENPESKSKKKESLSLLSSK